MPSSPLRRFSLGLLCGTVLLSTACEDLLNDVITVDPADRVAEGVLFDDPNQAGLLTSSVIAQFECSLGSYALALGLLGGEVNSLGNTQFFSLDRRTPDPAGGFNGLYGVNDCGAAVGSAPTYRCLRPAGSRTRWSRRWKPGPTRR